jgi:hypothetical protein
LISVLAVRLRVGVWFARFARSEDAVMLIVVLTRHPHLLRAESFPSPAPVVLTKPLDYARLLELLRERPAGKPPTSGLFLPTNSEC